MFKILFFLFITFSNFNNNIRQISLLDKEVSIDQKNSTIEKALDELKVVYDIKFSYVNNLIPLQNPIDIQISERPLSFVLEEIFRSTDISYSLVESQIVLKVKSKEIEKIEPEDSLQKNSD